MLYIARHTSQKWDKYTGAQQWQPQRRRRRWRWWWLFEFVCREKERNCKCAVGTRNAKAKVPTLRFIAVSLANAKQIHFGWAVYLSYTAVRTKPSEHVNASFYLFAQIVWLDYYEYSHWLCTCSQHTCRDRWRAPVLLFFPSLIHDLFVLLTNS